MILSIYTDGGARGNPGPAGFGVVVYDDQKKIIHQHSQYLGVKTNNDAEYSAVNYALTWLISQITILPINQVNLYLDSQLVVRQLNGQYKVKAANLKFLYQQSLSLISQISFPLHISHVYREQNYLADLLANQAMDRQC